MKSTTILLALLCAGCNSTKDKDVRDVVEMCATYTKVSLEKGVFFDTLRVTCDAVDVQKVKP